MLGIASCTNYHALDKGNAASRDRIENQLVVTEYWVHGLQLNETLPKFN